MSTEKAPLLAGFRLNSLFVVLLGVVFLVMSLQLPLGTPQAPGAGMWPLVVSIAMITAAVVLLFTERDGEDYEPLTRRSLVSVLGFIWIAMFVVMFQMIGFTLASLIFSVVWLRFLAKESWKFALIASPLFTIAFVLIFPVALGVPMPADPVLSLLSGGRY